MEGIARYAPLLLSNGIDGSVLHNCPSDDLDDMMKEMGIASSHRRFILLSIKEWKVKPVRCI